MKSKKSLLAKKTMLVNYRKAMRYLDGKTSLIRVRTDAKRMARAMGHEHRLNGNRRNGTKGLWLARVTSRKRPLVSAVVMIDLAKDTFDAIERRTEDEAAEEI